MIENISAISNIQPALSSSQTPKSVSTVKNEFKSIFQSTMEDLKVYEDIVVQDTKNLLTGNSTDLHTAMINIEKADIALQLTMQIRNKVIDAYKEIMRMQF